MVNGIPEDKALKLARKFLPHPARSHLAVPAPGPGEGYWVGAPSAVEYEGYFYLAYRLRHPVEFGRGQGVVIARSHDGLKFETVTMIPKDAMDAESLERPTLVCVNKHKWRLYLSCATAGTKHWRVEVLEASGPAELNPTSRKVVLPGDEDWAVKDTVIIQRDGRWHLWACFHPLDVRHDEDRMVSRYATSRDGLDWKWADGIALAPRPGKWDQRGVRITAVHFASDMVLAFYDGRASAAENYEERTGIAVGTSPDSFQAIGDEPFAQSADGRALRYLDILPITDGSFRTYYEIATPEDSHELRTEAFRL